MTGLATASIGLVLLLFPSPTTLAWSPFVTFTSNQKATGMLLPDRRTVGLNERHHHQTHIFLARNRATRTTSRSRAGLTVLSAFKNSDSENRDGLAASYIPLDDLLDQPITCDPDFGCLLDDEDTLAYRMESPLVVGIPALAPFVAFFTFDACAKVYRALTEFLSSNKWVAVDGGAYQAKMITPAINGLVVPAIALLFATLTSTTITTLRQRQVDVRRAINMEAGELRAIECLLDAITPGFVQDQCRDYVRFLILLAFRNVLNKLGSKAVLFSFPKILTLLCFPLGTHLTNS